MQGEDGVRHVIMGPNGAGKTTLLDAITGAVRPASGSISLGDQRIDLLPVAARVQAGIVRTFQSPRVFPSLSVLENIWIGANRRDAAYRFWVGWRGNGLAVSEAQEAASHLGLEELQGRMASQLSYGQRRMLEIAMAYASKPRLLLLDEPTAGLSRPERDRVIESLIRLSKRCPVVAIEHDLDIVVEFANWITVLHRGCLLREGPPAAIIQDEAVVAAYLGGEEVPHGAQS
ncbi:ATP-binding cassette domain-containing protein [Candidatus Berkelbacteria bacterium]|nr:ATP-binding cassette domain-containing protein [Candidatus Berkelbacteria bacterium]